MRGVLAAFTSACVSPAIHLRLGVCLPGQNLVGELSETEIFGRGRLVVAAAVACGWASVVLIPQPG